MKARIDQTTLGEKARIEGQVQAPPNSSVS
jgi:hypothetical protein